MQLSCHHDQNLLNFFPEPPNLNTCLMKIQAAFCNFPNIAFDASMLYEKTSVLYTKLEKKFDQSFGIKTLKKEQKKTKMQLYLTSACPTTI